jgi:hypothetical protein
MANRGKNTTATPFFRIETPLADDRGLRHIALPS